MSEPVYRISRGGHQSGEYTPMQLAQSLKRGTVRKTDFYWCKGMKEWKPVAELAPTLMTALAASEKEAREKAAMDARRSADQGRTFHFAREGKEYARIPEAQLREAWPAEIQSTDTCWFIGQSEWRPAWQLQNELRGEPAKQTPSGRGRQPVAPRPLSTGAGLGLRSNKGPSKAVFVAASVFVVLVLLFLLGGGSTSGTVTSSSRGASASDAQAISIAHEIIRSRLKAPATARFSNDWVSGHEESGAMVFSASGTVDSQNSFGALLRAEWRATFKVDRDGTVHEQKVKVSQDE